MRKAAAGDGFGVVIEPFALRYADVILATETLYTEDGTRQFVSTLALWLSSPDGACYLVNNARRTKLSALEGLCAQHGLKIERLPDLEGSGGCAEASASFAPPWDDVDRFAMLKITWSCNWSAWPVVY